MGGVNNKNNGEITDHVPQKGITFAKFTRTQWAAYLRKEEIEESTVYSYDSMLKKQVLPRFGEMQLGEITTGALTEFFDDLRTRLSKKYIINIYSLLSAIFDVAVASKCIQQVPLNRKLHRPKQRRVKQKEKPALSLEQVRVVLQCIPVTYRMLVLLIGTTGLRIGEILGLRRLNFNYETRQLSITHGLWRGRLKESVKTEASQATIELPEVIAELLNSHLSGSKFSSPTDFIFSKPDGSPLDPDWIRESVLYPALERAEIQRRPRAFGWHLFRHSAGSILYALTRDLKLVQELLRHTQISTTSNIYVHVERRVMSKGMELLADAILGNCSTTAPQESELIN